MDEVQPESEREQLKSLINSLERQRAALGDATADAAIESLRRKLVSLGETAPAESVERRSVRSGERKLVTVMFADLSGFTALSEKLDPERLLALINSCFGSLVPILRKFGGTVDKYMGDEIMALFGAPEAHENDSERAIRAALEMRDALAAFNAGRGTDLGMHFGINTGLVVTGDIGAEGRADYSVMGDAVNLAARLEEASERGQILVGPDTYRLTSRLFEFGSPESLVLKGKEAPVLVYKALGNKADSAGMRGLEGQGLGSVLVGREAELGILMGRIARLQGGEGGIVSVIGEAGLGKSRLVAEARALCRSSGTGDLRWLEGHTVSFGQGISYWPFRELFRSFAGISEEDDEDDAWRKLGAGIMSVFPDRVDEFLPYLASLISLPMREDYKERIALINSESMSRQIFLATRRFIEGLAKSRALVLVFEDLHWMDESSAALLEHILPLVRCVPLLVFCLSRSEPEGLASRIGGIAGKDLAERFAEIYLQALSPDASGALVRNLLSVDELPSRLKEIIQEKGEGNPFFVEEVLRTLIAMRAIRRDQASGRWLAAEGIETIALPDTIQGLIMARIDRLENEDKEVLRAGAVIGRSFLYRILSAMSEADGELDSRLEVLARIDLIREKARIPELEFAFKHALTHEATYESILLERRKELHAQVGACIERLFAERLESFFGLLAYHFARAESWEKAQEYLTKAGDQAGKMAADAEALDLYRQAMEAYSRAFGDRWDRFDRAVMERKIGEAYYRRSDYEKAREHLFRSLDLLGCSCPIKSRGMHLAFVKEILIQISHRLLLLFNYKSLEMNYYIEEELLRVSTPITYTYAFSDQGRALLFVLWMLNLTERRKMLGGMAVASAGIGYMLDCLGLSKIAGFYIHNAARLADRSGRVDAIAISREILTIHTQIKGFWKESIELSDASTEAFKRTGDLLGITVVFVVSQSPRRLTGDCGASISRLMQLTALCRDTGDANALSYSLHGLAHVLVYTGPLDEAVRCAEESGNILVSSSDYGHAADVRSELGFAYLRLGRLDEAIGLLENNLEYIKSHGVRGNTLTRPTDALAEAYLLKAESLPANERAPWLVKAGPACAAGLKQGRRDMTGWLPALRHRARLEWLRGRRASAGSWWRRAMKESQRLEAPYEIGMGQLERGERLRDRSMLEEAESILAKCGANLDREKARELLGALSGT